MSDNVKAALIWGVIILAIAGFVIQGNVQRSNEEHQAKIQAAQDEAEAARQEAEDARNEAEETRQEAEAQAEEDAYNNVSQTYWYCWDTGKPEPHHLGYYVNGDHYCTDGELADSGF